MPPKQEVFCPSWRANVFAQLVVRAPGRDWLHFVGKAVILWCRNKGLRKRQTVRNDVEYAALALRKLVPSRIIEFIGPKTKWNAIFAPIVDVAKETATDCGFTVEWEIPSEYMPASVPLRVNIDTQSVGENAIVEQGGKAIKRESDGSYVIEFTEKSLKVRKPKPGENPDSATSLPGSTTRPLANFPSNTKYTLFDLNGNDLGNVNGFEVPAKFPKGTYIIRAEANGQAPISKKVSR